MKVIYAGTPEFAVAPLVALHENGVEIVAVITAPDKPTGRKGAITPPPVKVKAEQLSIPVFQFDKISRHEDEVRAIGADIMITCAYGQILSDGIIAIFPAGIWNLHASLLPRHRGASPIQAAILAGDEYTGVTVMKTERELDAGDILLVKRCETGDKTYGELSDELSALAAEAAVEAVALVEAGDPQLLLQDAPRATYCKKIQKTDARIDFSNSPESVSRLVNAMNPAPLAYCEKGGSIVNIYKVEVVVGDAAPFGTGDDPDVRPGKVVAADKKNGIVVKCGAGYVRILIAQPAGGKCLSSVDLLNGRKILLGDVLE